MPTRPPHPWAPVNAYRDDEPPRIFMSPSESLETINHDDEPHGRLSGHGEDEDTPIVSRTAPLSPRRRPTTAATRPIQLDRPVRSRAQPLEERYSDRADPFADPALQQGFAYSQPDRSDLAPLRDENQILYANTNDTDKDAGHAYSIPGGYPNAFDPTINLLAWNNPAANPYLMQDLANIPYRPMKPRFQQWAKTEIKPEDCVLPLLLITFQTGVIDAATIKDFKTYTTGQTGNSILLALAVFGRRPANLLAAGLSMAGFCLFSVVFGQLGNVYGHKTRGWLMFTMSAQILLLIFNIILVSPALAGVLPEGGPFEWAVIFTGAASGAGQMVMAINSGCPEINTVGLTGLYAGLGSDPSLFKLLSQPNVIKRNRRLWFLVIFWGGTFFGGAIATYSDMWISLIFALECKVVAFGMMMLSSAFEVEKDWREKLAKEVELAEAYAE